ncbi:MAG: electron transfer flavoprotein subunit beta/FixA family protein [Thermoplasmata archaeon]
MNIIVCVKEVLDVSQIKTDPKSNKPILKGIDKKISDIDKNAVEEAIRIKDKQGGKVTVISVGPSESSERIKELLAMGADEAKIIPFEDTQNYRLVSKILAGTIKGMGDYDMVLCGEASIDMFSGQVAPRLAQLLKIPQITYAKSVDAQEDKITADKDLGEKKVTVESPYPVVVSVTKEINEPRLPSLMQILGAANKPVEMLDAAVVAEGELTPTIETVDVKGVSMERKNVIFKDDLDESVNELVDRLAKDGVLG